MTGDARSVIRRSRRGITYGRRGSGPAVVLVHGWCLDRTVWLYVEDDLIQAGFTVITPALAGYGASSDLLAPQSLSEHGSDLADLLDELDLTGVILCGFAFGAAVIMSMPDYGRAAGIVSVGIPSAREAKYTRMPAAMRRDWPLFAQRSATAIVSGSHSDAALAWLERVFASTPLDSALVGVEILSVFEPEDVEQSWSSASLFVHGSDDPIVPSSVSARCAERFAGRYVEVADCGHFVPMDQPKALSDALVAFAGELPV